MSAIFALEKLNNFVKDLTNSPAIGCDLRLVFEPLKHKSAQTELLEVP